MFLIKTHDGKEIALKQNDPAKIQQLAQRFELVGVVLNSGDVMYIAKGNVARIEEDKRRDKIKQERLSAGDYRGVESPAKDRLRKALADGELRALRREATEEKLR